MELYKLQEGKLIQAPTNLEWVDDEGVLHCETPVQEATLLAHGWKPKKSTEKPTIKWYEQLKTVYTENETTIFESFEVEPISSLRQTYLDSLLVELNRSLENDFMWAGHVVKLSESNQKDYLAGFTLATANPAMYIPMQYTFKDNYKHLMATIEELTEFTNMAFYFVSVTLEAYRVERDNANSKTDLELYNYVKTL